MEKEQRYQFEKIYKITRGFCMIINIINFDEREDLKRNDSEENVKLVKEGFEHVGFEVNDYCDLNDYEIINLIDEKVNDEKTKPFDAFVLYIHSHAILDRILCKNSYERNQLNQVVLTRKIHFYQIIKLFKDENCEYLIDKPKIIIFDCNRTGKCKILIIFHLINYLYFR